MSNESGQVDYDLIDRRITERFRLKKEVNLIISVLIVALGIASLYMAFGVEVGISSFVYLTINGTLFTTVGSLMFIGANIYELATLREIDHVRVYYLRLSCAVTETVIMLVILVAFAMGAKAQEKARAFGDDVFVERMVTLYEKLLGSRDGGRWP